MKPLPILYPTTCIFNVSPPVAQDSIIWQNSESWKPITMCTSIAFLRAPFLTGTIANQIFLMSLVLKLQSSYFKWLLLKNLYNSVTVFWYVFSWFMPSRCCPQLDIAFLQLYCVSCRPTCRCSCRCRHYQEVYIERTNLKMYLNYQELYKGWK